MTTLQLPAVRASLNEITAYVDQAVAAAGLNSKASYRLHLAVDEIATNIIIHGHEEAGLAGDIWLSAVVSPEALTLVIEDAALPFNPQQTAAPFNLDSAPEGREIGGLGVFLAMRSVDRLDYERVNGRNRTSFIMNRPAPGPGPT